MSILEKAHRGKIVQPHLWLIYGVGKVGKTSLVAEGPSPIIIGPEGGSANLDVTRLKADSYQEFMSILTALLKDPHEYKTLGIDSLDWLEPLIWEHVVATVPNAKTGKMMKSIDQYGYGDGLKFALEEWRKVIGVLNQIREKRGMNIVAIAHPQSKEAKDPTVTTDYNRYQLKLDSKAAALWREWVDCIFFINYETVVASSQGGKGKAVVFAGAAADRYIHTEWSTAWDAGNRFGLDPRIPYEKGVGWDAVTSAIAEANADNPETIKRVISNLIEQVTDENLKSTIVEKVTAAGDDAITLDRIRARLKIITNAPAA